MNTRPPLTLLVLAVLQDGPQHGYGIARAIRQRSGDRLDAKEGSLYPALHQLEAGGLVSSEEQHAEGRARRTYTLTGAGLAALREQREGWSRQVRAVQAVLGTAS